MTPAQQIVAALAEDTRTAELFSQLSPEIQASLQDSWQRIVEQELEALSAAGTVTSAPPAAAAPTPVVVETPAEPGAGS